MNVPKKSQRLLGVRGFTLVELMVALSGGLMVAMTMFVLAKNATRFYQREIRAANATTGVLNGFARLRADVARAGFLGSPNLRKDPRICNNPFLVGSAPTAVKELASIQLRSVTKSGTPTAEAGITPHELILTGAYTTADQFKVRAIVQEAGSVGIYLEPQSEAMSRLGSIVSIDENVLRQVFIVNQLARIVDQTGKHHYGVVSTVTGGANPKITLSNSTGIQFRGSGNNGGCGLTGNESEALINPVNIIRYRLANLSAIPEYAGAYRSVDATIPIDATRLDLIREMLDATGTPIANTTELVAEYAVDLRADGR